KKSPRKGWCMMQRSFELRLSGSGGQGLILAGIILARAAVIEKKKVTQTQSYGPESRGGYSRADVIISEEDIYFPEATHFDCLLALTQEACDKYIFDLKDEGLLIIDTTYVKNLAMTTDNTYEIPFTEIANERLGSSITTNIISLAFMVKLTGVVSDESLKTSISESVKPAFVDLNHKAMLIGFELAENYGKEA
ncbi:MAG: 2-oxoacid:acceptor oxidoreductase family protein, partial [Candidatus Cloacimonadaceae bacterium]|nr:2-oxoacid:acceptor oxidoreductase family protein [Candidatus Cloacimonadaceae bacterium]